MAWLLNTFDNKPILLIVNAGLSFFSKAFRMFLLVLIFGEIETSGLIGSKVTPFFTMKEKSCEGIRGASPSYSIRKLFFLLTFIFPIEVKIEIRDSIVSLL